MKIAILGAGNVGRALATASVRAGHTVAISSAKADEARKLAIDVGASAADSNRDAVSGADVVVLAVPFDAIRSLVDDLGAGLDGSVLVDVTNRFDPLTLGGPSNAERIQEMVPKARVVKAFNTVFASHQSDPTADGIQLDGFVAADDPSAKHRALALVESLGFRPIDAGPLAMARALEGMGLLNIALNRTNKWSWQTGWKLLGPVGPFAAPTA